MTFKKFLTPMKMETLIIGYFVSQGILGFYDSLFKDILTPMIIKSTPGDDNKTINFLGTEIHAHRFFTSLIKFILSLIIAYYVSKLIRYYRNKNKDE